MNKYSRRQFLRTSTTAAVGAMLIPGLVKAGDQQPTTSTGLVTGQPKPLSYPSIPGFLSAEQIAPHYTAHYGGALRGYIAADDKLQSSIMTGTTIDSSAYGAIQRARTKKANSVLLHELYFDGMALKTNQAKAEIRAAIEKRFGSMDKWAEDFQASAKAASGWAVLAYDPLNAKLYNIVSDKHATGVLWMATPLLVIDVYEHAYYLDYKNNKAGYIAKFMDHIDWGEVNRRYVAVG
ncbi:superoxide dismutase [Methyloprofundus sp.]|uniref:superoxide dismutase n=1 Tax=Methyloprofundus sp. TaxID=2020875 RepID=UPI003D11E911